MGVMHGAIALVKVNGNVVGKMRSVRWNDDIQRLEVRGLGTIMPDEAAATSWGGTVTCDLMEILFQTGGIPGALRRDFSASKSQVLSGGLSFEDQLVLDDIGVQLDVFKKVTDVINADGTIKPKLTPFAIISSCFITTDSCEISEGAISGRNQAFKYLSAITYAP